MASFKNFCERHTQLPKLRIGCKKSAYLMKPCSLALSKVGNFLYPMFPVRNQPVFLLSLVNFKRSFKIKACFNRNNKKIFISQAQSCVSSEKKNLCFFKSCISFKIWSESTRSLLLTRWSIKCTCRSLSASWKFCFGSFLTRLGKAIPGLWGFTRLKTSLLSILLLYTIISLKYVNHCKHAFLRLSFSCVAEKCLVFYWG